MVDTKRDHTFTFSRDERLKSRKQIETLFRRRSFVQDPFLRIYYSSSGTAGSTPAQFAFAVSKKNFPKAVNRNRIKRLMRESVRLAKPEFLGAMKASNKKMILLLSYQGKGLPEPDQVSQSVIALFKELQKIQA